MAAKAAEVEEVEEAAPEECPKCPPVGAPAWMATFADMATLLMAFFVLILSFAEFNVPKFKQISGSLQNAFGVQKVVPVVEQPQGTTLLQLEFSPSPSPSVTNEMTQETTELQKPELELQTKTEESVDGDTQNREGAAQGTGAQTGQTGEAGSDGEMDAQALASALQEAIESGEVEVEMNGENVVVNFPSQETEAKDLPSLVQETLAALAEARQASGQAETEVLFGGLEQQLAQLAAAAQEAASNQGENPTPESAEAAARAEAAAQQASAAVDQLQVALREEIAQGLVEVEQRDGKVYVTVGAGGAFPSGSADLTAEAVNIMNRIAFASMSSESTITVAGHTDDIPIATTLFRDNWDLAAGRASSVVQAIQATGLVDGGRMRAVSYGETKPVEDNATPEGRERNRRIVIEIEY
ncbi:MAG: flagellar motor protein MotB [Gemmobacter sp.]